MAKKRLSGSASVTKVCTSCGKRRTLDEYRAEKRTELGLSSICNICHADYMKDYMRFYRKAKRLAVAARARKRAKPAVKKTAPRKRAKPAAKRPVRSRKRTRR